MNRLFLALAAVLLLLVGLAAAKDSHDRQYLSIQDQYRKDHPGSQFDSKVQQLFPVFSAAKQGDTFRTERCISCHVPDIAVIGPQVAARNLSADFLKYEPDAQHMIKAYGLTLNHPAAITQQLYDQYGADAYATSDGFHPYTVAGDNGPQQVKLPGFIPSFLSPAANGGKPLGIDQVGCITCHNGSRLALDDTAAHQNLIVNPEYSFTEGAALYYKYCVSCHGSQGEVASKSTPTDLVSDADLASEQAIRQMLAARRPQDGFVGEEGGDSGEGHSGLSWIVDPLDGTVNFLFGIPQWCVSVAVRDDHGVLAGAIYDPNRDELFSATRDGPAELVGAGGRVSLAGRARAVVADAGSAHEGGGLASAMIATGLYYDASVRAAQAKVLERLVGRVRDIRRFGAAALDLAWTAAGRYDAYFERGVKQWDVAAGALICERAGLRVLELPEQPELPWGILVAPEELAGHLFELVAGV